MGQTTEISWKMVVVLALLISGGILVSLFGKDVLGASLVSGALGYLAQGAGSLRRGVEEGAREREASQDSGGGVRLPVIPLFLILASLLAILNLGCSSVGDQIRRDTEAVLGSCSREAVISSCECAARTICEQIRKEGKSLPSICVSPTSLPIAPLLNRN
jgi:hypothetical protein